MTSPRASEAPRFRPDIEGLRAIAVLLVVAFHAGVPTLRGGFIGVDVFFVLSGFLITGILVRQLESNGRIELVKFFARRMLRLLPAAALMLVVTIIAENVLFSPLNRIELSSSALATALYSSNMYFMFRAANYFSAGAATNPVLHTWSLAVEEQFYLVWPFLLFAAWRTVRSRRRVAILLSIVAVLSFAGEVWLTHKKQPWAFFSMPARAWEFGLGGLVALLPAAAERFAAACRWLGWLGLAVVVASAAWLSEATSFPGAAALVPVLGTCAVLFAGSSATRGAQQLLQRQPFQWIGRHSYTWYLWHWPILVIGPVWMASTHWSVRLVCVAISLAAAAATTALVENPIRFRPSLVARPGLVLCTGGLATIAVALFAFAAHLDATARGERYANAAFDVSGLNAAGCSNDFSEVRARLCVFGDSASPVNVVLFGDSHAGEWFPAFASAAREHHWRLTTLVKFSCPAARVLVFNSVLHREYTECEAWREDAIRRITALRPSAVIIGELASGITAVRPDGSTHPLDAATWGAAVRTTVSRLDAAGIATVLLRDSPTPGIHVPECLSRAEMEHRPAGDCAVPRSVALSPQFYAAERSATADLANVRHVDLSERICGPIVCEPIRDGRIVYKDTNHLTVQFAEYMSPYVEQAIAPLVLTAIPLASAR